MKKILLGIISSTLLTACGTVVIPYLTDRPDHVVGRYQRMPKLAIDNLTNEQKKYQYANQLLKQNQPYATIVGYPYADFSNGFLLADPLHVVSIDEQLIHAIPQKDVYYSAIQMSFTPLKIPAGTHQLVVAGAGFENSAKYTKFSDINFEVNKTYIIKPEVVNNRFAKLVIYEYEYDSRFPINDIDSIILKQPISTPMPIGNTNLFAN